MMEHSPLNFIRADTDLVIRYMNPASRNTLSKLAHLLPCKVDEIVGKSVDIFHKNPAYQRKILSDPRNLPHKVDIRLGPETLNLIVSAIYDDSKNYVGTMVAWEVVTERVRAAADNAGQIAAIGKSQAAVEFQMDGTVVSANDNFLKTVGYTMDEIKGKHHSIFVDEPYRHSPEYREFWAKLNRGEYQTGEYKRISKSGKVVWLQAAYNPIMDMDGKPFKVVKYATDVTQDVKAKQEMERIQSMVENAPNNIIYADRDLNIQYMNPASSKTLMGLEKYLPVKVSQMMGQSIDVFHKDPSHQRRILANDKNLPHRAEIGVGPETLDLQVCAIYDKNKNCSGYMLTWEIVTEKRAEERKFLETAEREKTAADAKPSKQWSWCRILSFIRCASGSSADLLAIQFTTPTTKS